MQPMSNCIQHRDFEAEIMKVRDNFLGSLFFFFQHCHVTPLQNVWSLCLSSFFMQRSGQKQMWGKSGCVELSSTINLVGKEERVTKYATTWHNLELIIGHLDPKGASD